MGTIQVFDLLEHLSQIEANQRLRMTSRNPLYRQDAEQLLALIQIACTPPEFELTGWDTPSEEKTVALTRLLPAVDQHKALLPPQIQ